MHRARVWVAGKLLLAARAVLGPEEESLPVPDDEEEGGVGVVLSAEARRMLAEGELEARREVERRTKKPEPAAPARGSLRDRIAEARRTP